MTAAPRILIVEDDTSVRDAIADYLTRHGFVVDCVNDGAAMDRALAIQPANLLILDIMLPGEDGLSICRRLPSTPILILSAMGSTIDRVVGLELGASDYLAKPFDPRELLARVRAILRRGTFDGTSSSTVWAFAGFRFEPDTALLHDPAGRPVELTAGEVRLLEAFVRHAGRVLRREQLLDAIHGNADGPFDRAVDLAISRLRRKLYLFGSSDLIETVRGLGYRLRAKVSVS